MSTSAGGALAFLNQGVTPSANSNYSQSSSQLPSWYTDYTQQILNSAAQFAAQPYQTYQGPRIANQDANTTNAYSQVGAVPGDAAWSTANANNTVGTAVNNNNPLAAANPYLAQGTNPTYNTVGSYLNPAESTVLGGIANAANTNFNNYTMPALESGIIGSGNITGSSTEGTNLMENAEQQNEQTIQNTQSQALQNEFGTALNAAQSGNANALTAANTAGNLNTAQTQNDISAANTQANIGTAGVNNTLAGIGAENTLGQQNQGYNQSNLNLAYQDYLNQLNYPLTQASEMQSALQGIQVPTAQVNYNYGTGLAGTTGTSPLGALSGVVTGLGGATSPSTLTTNVV